jgi:hypothetical protein
MDTRRDGDSDVTRPTADRDALRAVEATVPWHDVGLLRDAAALLTARQELDALLVQLTAAPFSATAYDGLRAYLAGSGRRTQVAYARLCASTGTVGR